MKTAITTSNQAFVDAVRRIRSACWGIIERGVTGPGIHNVRFLIKTVLMKAVGITHFLASPTMDHSRGYTDELRLNIHHAFGSPDDWGRDTPLGQALADLYQASTLARS